MQCVRLYLENLVLVYIQWVFICRSLFEKNVTARLVIIQLVMRLFWSSLLILRLLDDPNLHTVVAPVSLGEAGGFMYCTLQPCIQSSVQESKYMKWGHLDFL